MNNNLKYINNVLKHIKAMLIPIQFYDNLRYDKRNA